MDVKVQWTHGEINRKINNEEEWKWPNCLAKKWQAGCQVDSRSKNSEGGRPACIPLYWPLFCQLPVIKQPCALFSYLPSNWRSHSGLLEKQTTWWRPHYADHPYCIFFFKSDGVLIASEFLKLQEAFCTRPWQHGLPCSWCNESWYFCTSV